MGTRMVYYVSIPDNRVEVWHGEYGDVPYATYTLREVGSARLLDSMATSTYVVMDTYGRVRVYY